MPRDPKLDETAVRSALLDLPAWTLTAEEIVRTLRFATFPAAVAFVDRVAVLAEAADHHPDIDIRYNEVRFALVTHDSGGITHRDIALATEIERTYTSLYPSQGASA